MIEELKILESDSTTIEPTTEIVEQGEEIVEHTTPVIETLRSEPEAYLEELRQEGTRTDVPSRIKWTKYHTQDLIIGDPNTGIKTRAATSNECFYLSFLSQEEPKKIEEALGDSSWIEAMQEELN